MRRAAPIVALAALVVAVVAIVVSSGGSSHELRAALSNAISLRPGLDVQIDGRKVGAIDSVDLRNGQPVAKLNVDEHWPLPKGTTAVIRYGTTLGLGTRYVQLIPGPGGGPTLGDGDLVPQQQAVSAVEFDELFNMFDARTRADVRHVADGLARATADQPQRVGPAVRATADTLQAAHGLLADLGKDQRALDALVRQGSRATATLAAKRPVIEDLLTVAGTTFREFGSRSAAIRASLDEFAPALRQANGTLVRVDGSLGKLDGLVSDLRPALGALRPFVVDARPALAGLRRLAPATARTLATLTNSAPSITRFTRAAQRFSAPLQDALSKLSPQLACVRPYGPDIAAFLTTWASWGQDYDDTSHYARVKAIEGPTSLNSFPPIPTDTFLGLTAGGLKYAMPRPPGLNAGKPDYLADCGAGRAATDPSKDPEDGK